MAGMARPGRSARVALVAVALATLTLGLAPADRASAALPPWTGGMSLYRDGVFTTQKTWRWCTAASVQIMRNIKYHREDHSRASQERYWDYMRAHNGYPIPASAGVDPAGWTAGLRRFVDDRYRRVEKGSFGGAIRSAVRSMRRTSLPVALAVARGGHAWILVGFTATADPAKTSEFTVTSLRVVGPLWGRQSTSWGYDMRPNRKLTRSQLKTFFRPWHYAPIRMAWEGKWVSIQPIGP